MAAAVTEVWLLVVLLLMFSALSTKTEATLHHVDDHVCFKRVLGIWARTDFFSSFVFLRSWVKEGLTVVRLLLDFAAMRDRSNKVVVELSARVRSLPYRGKNFS